MDSYLIANWKMNKTREEAEGFLSRFFEMYKTRPGVTAVICPPFTTVSPVGDKLRGKDGVYLGAQNVHWDDKGAHTAEISALMLGELGVRYAIVGHSERYQYYGETPENVSKRAAQALKHGIKPVICVGERREDYEAGRSQAVVLDQLKRSLNELSSTAADQLIIAYEPVWAIGTGLAANPEVAQAMHGAIRGTLVEKFGENGKVIPILYGGSTTPDNIAEYMAQPDIAGALIGGAALDPEKYWNMIDRGRKS